MLPVKRIKVEDSEGKTSEITMLSSEEVKIEESDTVGNIDSEFLVLDEADIKIETHDSDFDTECIKDEFDLEIIKQELDNNDTTLLCSNGELEILPREKYLDMKRKIEESECHMSEHLVEKEYLLYRIAELSVEKKKKLKNVDSENLILDLKTRVARLENQAKVSDAKLQQNDLKVTRLEQEIDGLQKYICLLSTNNSKLKCEVEGLTQTVKEMGKKNTVTMGQGDLYEEMVNNTRGVKDVNDDYDLEQLKEMIRCLIKDKNFFKDQLDKKIAELKVIQQRYGKTIIAFSNERRKTELWMNKVDSTDESTNIPPRPTIIRRGRGRPKLNEVSVLST